VRVPAILFEINADLLQIPSEIVVGRATPGITRGVLNMVHRGTNDEDPPLALASVRNLGSGTVSKKPTAFTVMDLGSEV